MEGLGGFRRQEFRGHQCEWMKPFSFFLLLFVLPVSCSICTVFTHSMPFALFDDK